MIPLEGGTPIKIATPGPVSWIEWSPDGQWLALVVSTGLRDPDEKDPVAANAPREVRGAHNRLDGRTHIFVHELSSATTRQVTSGDYNHEQPSWSPDTHRLVLVSDRSRQRNDIGERGEVWTITTAHRGVRGACPRAACRTQRPDPRFRRRRPR